MVTYPSFLVTYPSLLVIYPASWLTPTLAYTYFLRPSLAACLTYPHAW
jgi:hypothetical protein